MLIDLRRGRYRRPHGVRAWSYYLRFAMGLRHAILDLDLLFRPPSNLSLGIVCQLRAFDRLRDCGFRWQEHGSLVGTGFSRLDHLRPVHLRRCARFVGIHWRDISHPPQAPFHWNGPRCLLHR